MSKSASNMNAIPSFALAGLIFGTVAACQHNVKIESEPRGQTDAPLTTRVCTDLGLVADGLGMHVNIPAPMGDLPYRKNKGPDEKTLRSSSDILNVGRQSDALIKSLGKSGLDMEMRSHKATKQAAKLSQIADAAVWGYYYKAPDEAQANFNNVYFSNTQLDKSGVTKKIAKARRAVERVGVEYCDWKYPDGSTVPPELRRYILPLSERPVKIYSPQG